MDYDIIKEAAFLQLKPSETRFSFRSSIHRNKTQPFARLVTVAERNEKGFEPIVIKIRIPLQCLLMKKTSSHSQMSYI